MARDRLEALKALEPAKDDPFVSIELNTPPSLPMRSTIEIFYQEVEEIGTNIDQLNHNVDQVKKIHSEILSTPQTDEKVKKKLETLMADIQTNATEIKGKLKRMELETNKIGQENSLSAEHRIRTTQYRMLFRRFKDVIDDYQLTQADHRDRCKARIKRQLDITGHHKSDDEIEDMIESGNPAIFNSEIIMETQQAKQSLAEIQARHLDIMKLEKSITELRDLFVEIATLVETQGEMVNRIETHVANAKSHVDKGGAEVNQAIAYRSKARIKKFICFACLIIFVLVIVAGSFLV